MNFFKGKLKLHMGRAAAAAAVFGAAWLVIAYSRGYFDLSFLDRNYLLDEILEQPSRPTDNSTDSENQGKETDSSGNFSADSSAENPAHSQTGTPAETDRSDYDTPSVTNRNELESVVGIYNTYYLADVFTSVPLLSDLSGYTPTDRSYLPSGMTLAKMQFSFKLPTEFSLRDRLVEKVHYIVTEEYAPYRAKYLSELEARPAVELYMGMILIDTGDLTVIVSGDGVPLCSFDDSVYKPAYTRDLEGRPLFQKEKEDGEKTYYYLSDDGKNFTVSDYNDETDSRGLYFDYPAYWGISDGSICREFDEEKEKWAYKTEYSDLTEPVYDLAYDFAGGLACVTKQTDENRGGMFFINEYGWQVQSTFVMYLSELNRYSIWDYALPASRGIENLGFFYYDHGLTRVRYQIIDYYNWLNGRVRVVSDEDKLIRTDGSMYPLPQGFTLKGYSEGMILLEKDGLYGFMDYTGKWIAEPCYISATPFVCGLSVLRTIDGRYGMIDTDGNIVLPFTYDYISLPSSGLIAAYREENGWMVMKVMSR